MNKRVKIFLGLIIALFSINSAFADTQLQYDLSDLGNLRGDDTQYIDTITVDEKSNISIFWEFRDCDRDDEIELRFNGTNFKLYCWNTRNRDYVANNDIWSDIEPGQYILEWYNNYGKNQSWGLGKIKLNISTKNLGSSNTDTKSDELLSAQVKFFMEKDDLIKFFKDVWEIYYLIIIMMFLYFVFGRLDNNFDF